MEQPEGFIIKEKDNYAYRITKSLYDLNKHKDIESIMKE